MKTCVHLSTDIIDRFETETLELMSLAPRPSNPRTRLLYDYADHLLMARRFYESGDKHRAHDYDMICDRITRKLESFQ